MEMKKLTLDEIKTFEINILDYIVEVCNKNHIQYYLGYGTLLGAIRHNGFIPWDDDVDLVMMREDYDRFLMVALDNPHPRFKVLSPKEKGYFYTFVKVVDTKTKVFEKEVEQMPDNGVWVDIFPLDNVKTPNSLHTKLCYLLNKCRAAAIYRRFPKEKGISYLKWRFCKTIGYSIFLRFFLMICDKYRNRKCQYVSVISNPYKNMFEKSIFEKTTTVGFEGKMYVAPLEYEKWLTLLYGDYMKLPCEADRITHRIEAYMI